MSFADVVASLEQSAPPKLGPALHALWCERKGDWEKAHVLAQAETTPAGSWVHAYLHRREGDEGNAGYWYRRAGKPFPIEGMDEEWASIARALLAQG